MFLYPWGDMHSLNLGWFLLQFKDWVEKIQEYLDNGGGTSENLANVIAPVFNAANYYQPGDYVLYNNELYKANQAVNPGTWDPDAWTRCLVTEEMGSGGAGVDNVARLMIAGQYSTTYGYQKYAICRYNDKLWMCNTNLPSSGEAWNPAHWDEITVGAGLTGLRRSVDSLAAAIIQKWSFFTGKKALIIGDSYNKGPENGWGYYFKTITGMGNNVTSIQQSGGGFGRKAGSTANYPDEYFYQAIAHVSSDLEFDYVIAQAGRNDAYSPEDPTGALLETNIELFISTVRTRWPNARLFIIPTNNNSPMDDAHEKLMEIIPKTAMKNGVPTSFLSYKWFYDTNYNYPGDNAHLTGPGYEKLAEYIAGTICGWNGVLPKTAFDHKNLLKNSIFSRFIINSRGITTEHITGSTQKRIIDGWYCGRCDLSVLSDGISLAWNGIDSTNGWISQRWIKVTPHSHFTMSAVIDGKLYYKTFQLKDDQTTYDYNITASLIFRCTLQNPTTLILNIYNYSTTAVKISGVKFEYGDEQTLATEFEGNTVIIDGSNYAEEIAKCRTVLIPLYANVGSQSQIYTGARNYSTPTMVTMAIPDMLKMVNDDQAITLEYDSLQGAIVDPTGTSQNITNIAVNGKFAVAFTVDGDLAPGAQAIYLNRIVYITSE